MTRYACLKTQNHQKKKSPIKFWVQVWSRKFFYWFPGLYRLLDSIHLNICLQVSSFLWMGHRMPSVHKTCINYIYNIQQYTSFRNMSNFVSLKRHFSGDSGVGWLWKVNSCMLWKQWKQQTLISRSWSRSRSWSTRWWEMTEKLLGRLSFHAR